MLAIYRHALATGIAALDDTVPTWEQFDARHLPRLRYIARDERHTVLGWVAAGPAFATAADAPVIEHGIYVHTPTRTDAASAAACSTPSSVPPPRRGCTASRPGSSPRTPPASPCTHAPGSPSPAANTGSTPIRGDAVLHLMEVTPPPSAYTAT